MRGVYSAAGSSTFNRTARSGPLRYAPSATSAANRDFIGDGAVVSYLNNKGDNNETYGDGTSLYVRALRHLRICPDNSSRVGRQESYHIQECRAASRLATELWQFERQFQRLREPRCVGPLWRLLWAHDSLRRRR